MRKVALAATALCALLAIALPAVAQAHHFYLGINANTRAWGTPGEEQENVVETGSHRIREDLEWSEIEPATGTLNWESTDMLYTEAAERGISILPVVDSPPCWAVPEETSPWDCWQTWPENDEEFAYFVARAVERYGPGGDFWEENPELDGALAPRYWEVWNEPYYPGFTNDEVDPARYATLYKTVVAAAREANPEARFLIESTVDATVHTWVDPKGWVHWAEAMVEAVPTLGNYVDGIAIHPYPEHQEPDYEPENGTDAAFKNTDLNRERWLELGVNKPIWITEIGYTSCNDGAEGRCVDGANQAAREAVKAEWLTQIFDELGGSEYPYVHAVYLYNLREWGDPEAPSSNPEDFYGILDGEGNKLPAWTSFADAVEEYDGVPTPNSTITGYSVEGLNAEFSFHADDPTSTFECQIDSGEWSACSSPKKYTGLFTGSHEFVVRAGNAEATENIPADMGWARRPPSTVAEDSGTGTLTWANVGNAKSSDGFYSTAEVTKKGTSTAHYLKATNFGYSVPGGETIVGIQASIERSKAGSGSGEVKDARVRIVKAGTVQSAVDKSTGAKWPTTDTVTRFGGEGDLWGQSWSASDINNSGFGVAISPTLASSNGTIKAQVDEIELTVFWD